MTVFARPNTFCSDNDARSLHEPHLSIAFSTSQS